MHAHTHTHVFPQGAGAFLQGLGPTSAGYFLAGAVAFGVLEVLKRLSVVVLGPQVAIAHPFVIVLACGAIAVVFSSIAVIPFEATRIRMVQVRPVGDEDSVRR